LAEHDIDDVLTYALFPQIGLKFLENRGNPAAFEPVPTGKESAPASAKPGEPEVYTVTVNGKDFVVQVADGGDITGIKQRSEEHTSELQSRDNLVCRLLLEKKKRRRA